MNLCFRWSNVSQHCIRFTTMRRQQEDEDSDNYVTASSRLGDELAQRAAAAPSPQQRAQPNGTPAQHAYYPMDALETLAGVQQRPGPELEQTARKYNISPHAGDAQAAAHKVDARAVGIGGGQLVAPMLAQAAAAAAHNDGTKRLYLSILLAAILLLCLLLYFFADLEINVIDMGAGNDNVKIHSDAD